MPKSGESRRRIGSTSYYTDDTVYNPGTNKSKFVPNKRMRNYVGDEGAEKLRKSRKTINQLDDVVSSSDKQDTPTENRAKGAEYQDKLIGNIKKAMKKGSATNRSNYE